MYRFWLFICVVLLGLGGGELESAIQAEISAEETVALTPEQLLEQDVLVKVNEYRQSLDLPPLIHSDAVADMAREHSKNMADGSLPFGHDGFGDRFQQMHVIVNAMGGAENIAFNNGYEDPGLEAVNGWIESDGHRRNMEGDYTLTGIGIAVSDDGTYYFTQLFAK